MLSLFPAVLTGMVKVMCGDGVCKGSFLAGRPKSMAEGRGKLPSAYYVWEPVPQMRR